VWCTKYQKCSHLVQNLRYRRSCIYSYTQKVLCQRDFWISGEQRWVTKKSSLPCLDLLSYLVSDFVCFLDSTSSTSLLFFEEEKMSALSADRSLHRVNKKKPHRKNNLARYNGPSSGHGPYRRLWVVCACPARWRASTGSWATPPTTGAVQIERGGDYYLTFDHDHFRWKTPSSFAPPAMAHTAARGPFAPIFWLGGQNWTLRPVDSLENMAIKHRMEGLTA
jgi:hypothetical protein